MKNLQTYEDFILESLILEATQKDLQRINDIVTKSKGDESKMLMLANTMCKLITDKNKAFDRGVAADQILGSDHPVTKVFFDRAGSLGMDVDKSMNSINVLPGSKRPSSEQFKTTRQFSSGYRGGGCAILPCGSLNLTSGENKYFNVKTNGAGTIEIWKTNGDEKYRAVITSGSNPLWQIGTQGHFSHDQTGRPLFTGTMVDYIESAHMEALIPLYGKSITCAVYK
jgi:hypothetical protein